MGEPAWRQGTSHANVDFGINNCLDGLRPARFLWTAHASPVVDSSRPGIG
jgi:hypothetical protein